MFIRLIFSLLLYLLSSFSSEGSMIGIQNGRTVRFEYDTEGRLSGMRSSGWEVFIGRDKSGLEIQRELSGGERVATERDQLGRVTEQGIFSNNVEKSCMRFHWDMGNRLLRKTNLLTSESDRDKCGEGNKKII
ncbi:hypothetical protein [Prevotella sp. HUN102]|uniref:hypothetical protein n=1 Tax=Prevotella sp. HUN102 TaxID=1392486 RepID=UPI0012DBF309|nr:hypothetical protein [Prevotella sp. HUN102]